MNSRDDDYYFLELKRSNGNVVISSNNLFLDTRMQALAQTTPRTIGMSKHNSQYTPSRIKTSKQHENKLQGNITLFLLAQNQVIYLYR